MQTATQNTREFRAEAKFQRVSPQKARLVLDLIKGQRVEQALNTIMFTKKGVAPLVEKVLRSALQNANYLSGEQGLDVDVDNLYVKTAIANDGPRMKRIRPAPMGRAFRYQRRISASLSPSARKRFRARTRRMRQPRQNRRSAVRQLKRQNPQMQASPARRQLVSLRQRASAKRLFRRKHTVGEARLQLHFGVDNPAAPATGG
jgi:large subunit ribosomal protein L22